MAKTTDNTQMPADRLRSIADSMRGDARALADLAGDLPERYDTAIADCAEWLDDLADRFTDIAADL